MIGKAEFGKFKVGGYLFDSLLYFEKYGILSCFCRSNNEGHIYKTGGGNFSLI